jgi:ABC-2 type transport system ATP-binding protein
LFEELNVLQYCYLIGSIYSLKKHEIDTKITTISPFFFPNLKDLELKIISELSTGQKKKVGLMGSVLHNPELIIWDEPFENLDFDGIDSITDFINAQKNMDHTIIYTSPKNEFGQSHITVDLTHLVNI